jgi:galactitol-specific phosphotransferase system IIB component
MKILYIIKQEPDETLKTIMDEHNKKNEVTVVDLRENKNYDRIIDLIVSSDKVISW